MKEITYGRKIVRGTQRNKSEYYKKLYISWAVSFLIGAIIGGILGWGIYSLSKHEPVKMPERKDVTTVIEPKTISLGEYRLTAYCSCEKCCGEWAKNRPLDENGNPIIYTASMNVAKQGVTVAADTSVLPFGTVLLIDGHEYIVQDRGGAIKGNRIDVYFESHEEALQFGVQYKEIFMKEG